MLEKNCTLQNKLSAAQSQKRKHKHRFNKTRTEQRQQWITSRAKFAAQEETKQLRAFLENELLQEMERHHSTSDSPFELFDESSAFHPRLRVLIMDLLQHQVADTQITTIIADFAAAFDLNIDLDLLPSIRTIGRIGEETSIIGHHQAAQCIMAPANAGALGLTHDGSMSQQLKMLTNGVRSFFIATALFFGVDKCWGLYSSRVLWQGAIRARKGFMMWGILFFRPDGAAVAVTRKDQKLTKKINEGGLRDIFLLIFT